MSRQSIGDVKFRDLAFNISAQIIITRILGDNLTYLFLIVGGGDCEIGLDPDNTRRLRTLLQKAISIPPTENSSWQLVGEAEFSWSDHADQSESGEDSGTVLIESNGSVVRMVIRTKKWAWEPYVATFSRTILDEFSALLSRALHES